MDNGKVHDSEYERINILLMGYLNIFFIKKITVQLIKL